MTLYIVGLRYKTRSHALTIEAEDALIAALKVKHAKPDATIITFENPIGVGTIVIRMKDCRIRNEMRQQLHHPVRHPADAVQEHAKYGGQGKTARRTADSFAIWRRSARRVIRKL